VDKRSASAKVARWMRYAYTSCVRGMAEKAGA